MNDEKPENKKRRFWKNWPWWVKVIAVIWMLLPLFLLYLAPKWISLPQENGSPQILFNDVRTIMLVLAAWYGVPFLIWRTILADKQTQISQESHYTELFTKAVEQLGAVREVPGKESEPALEIRIGAIYSLERLAKDSERDYGPIIETLAAYIREHCRDPKSFDNESLSGEELEQAGQKWIESLGKNPPENRSDVAAALTVLSRREENRNWIRTSDHETQPDFSGANFQSANLMDVNLSGANLEKANLSDANLENANLSGANLENTNISSANLKMANLSGAKLLGANLAVIELFNADLRQADLSGANLWNAKLPGANLWEAELEGANLWEAELEGANLARANLENAVLVGAQLKDSKGLTDEMLEKAFGDAATYIPSGLTRPANWGSREDAIKKWEAFLQRKWQAIWEGE